MVGYLFVLPAMEVSPDRRGIRRSQTATNAPVLRQLPQAWGAETGIKLW